MLSFILRELSGRETVLTDPVRAEYTSSEGAPSDGLKVTFSVDKEMPDFVDIEVRDMGIRAFRGNIDAQILSITKNGKLMTLKARSLAGILTDNEAMPQTYSMPSMSLLMKRHFEPLGFRSFRGEDKVYRGDLCVKKGMSEWAVLERFCSDFISGKPRVDKDGVIDISGEHEGNVLLIDPSSVIEIRYTTDRRVPVSEAFVRTYSSGGYELRVENKTAVSGGIVRKRYINAADDRSGSVSRTEELLAEKCGKFRRLTVVCSGIVGGSVGDVLQIGTDNRNYRIISVNCVLDGNGERTAISAEVMDD